MINNNWVFGDNCGLDFSASPAPPTPTSGWAISTFEGCSSISDTNGNLLFYTDGVTIWDSTNAVRATGLKGSQHSTQSAIIVPDPGNNKQYYVFTTDQAGSTPNHFDGGLLNINGSSWVFTPLASLMTLPNTAGLSPVEKVTAIQHENCRDFWVITMLQNAAIGATTGDGILRVFLVDSSGVHHIPDTPLNQTIVDSGYMKASPDGLKLAIANFSDNKILVYPFNKSTGAVNVGGLLTINTPTGQNYGLEFSPKSSLLYYSEPMAGPIYQVDLSTVSLTSIIVGNLSGNAIALQLGRDNRIYIARGLQNSIAAILYPDVQGPGCIVDNNFITLPSGSTSRLGLPNLISSYCTQDDDCRCAGCNKQAEDQNKELIDRAKLKQTTVPSDANCATPFVGNCPKSLIQGPVNFEPCFYFHWGDGVNDQIEEHDTEVFYLTVCNAFNDIIYNGLRINKVTLNPDINDIDKIHIVPDRLISLDCLAPCSCQTREFALITRANNIAGNYTLEVEYCYDEIVIASSGSSGIAKFPVTITED